MINDSLIIDWSFSARFNMYIEFSNFSGALEKPISSAIICNKFLMRMLSPISIESKSRRTQFKYFVETSEAYLIAYYSELKRNTKFNKSHTYNFILIMIFILSWFFCLIDSLNIPDCQKALLITLNLTTLANPPSHRS